jgi:uncharacterized protein YciI
MAGWFVVIRSHGRAWDRRAPLRKQKLWDEHARFIDDLVERRVIRLAGPLGTDDALLVVRANDATEIQALMDADPWTPTGQLTTARIEPWNVLVGEL